MSDVIVEEAPIVGRDHRFRNGGPPWWLSPLAHVLVFAAVAEVALFRLGTSDAAPDEFTYRTCGNAYLHGRFTCNLEHPPLAKELLALGSLAFHDSVTAARVTTALFAIATAYFCYLFCRDVAGRWCGLAAAAMWGLLPQAGVENHTVIESVRVSRFGLLDPYVAAFFALALVASLRTWRTGERRWAVCLGASVAAAAAAKAPGALIAPVLCIAPLVARKIDRERVGALVGSIVAGAAAIGLLVYGPFGPARAISAIRYMFDFQTSHASREIIVGGHFHTSAPWWADFAFATSGTGLWVALALVGLAIVGAVHAPKAALLALGASVSVVLAVGFGLHLSQPHYYLDWEPGVVVAAALGLHALALRTAPARWPVAGAVSLVLLVAIARTVVAANGVSTGPYELAARQMHCSGSCVVAYVGFLDVYGSYLPPTEYLSAVPPSTRSGRVVARVRSGDTTLFIPPAIVALDPAAYPLHGSWRRSIAYFVAHAARLGYREVPTGSRITVYRLRGTAT